MNPQITVLHSETIETPKGTRVALSILVLGFLLYIAWSFYPSVLFILPIGLGIWASIMLIRSPLSKTIVEYSPSGIRFTTNGDMDELSYDQIEAAWFGTVSIPQKGPTYVYVQDKLRSIPGSIPKNTRAKILVPSRRMLPYTEGKDEIILKISGNEQLGILHSQDRQLVWNLLNTHAKNARFIEET